MEDNEKTIRFLRNLQKLILDFLSEIENENHNEKTHSESEEKIYTKEELNSLGVYALRNLARDVGVHAPTKKRIDNLVYEIMAIQSGVQMPCEKSRRGRPPK